MLRSRRLQAFEPGATVFIVGGYDKHIDLSAFEALLAERAGGVIGIGQTGEAMVKRVGDAGLAEGRRMYAETLETCVAVGDGVGERDGGDHGGGAVAGVGELGAVCQL